MVWPERAGQSDGLCSKWLWTDDLEIPRRSRSGLSVYLQVLFSMGLSQSTHERSAKVLRGPRTRVARLGFHPLVIAFSMDRRFNERASIGRCGQERLVGPVDLRSDRKPLHDDLLLPAWD